MPAHRPTTRRKPTAVGRPPDTRARPGQLPGGRHGLTPEQVVESQRERVLAALRTLVASRKLRDITVAEVIRHAGVSRKTFYELYAGKEDCFAALYERELDRLLVPALAAFEGGGPWPDRLRGALGVLLGGLAAEPDGARICFVEVMAAGPTALERRNAGMARLATLFLAADGSDGGSRTTDVSGAAGYLAEVLGREIAAGRTSDLPGLVGPLTDTLAPVQDANTGTPAGPTAHDASESAFLSRYGPVAARLISRVGAAVGGAADPAGAIRAGIGAALAECAADPDGARLWMVESLSVGAGARERRAQTVERLSELLEEPLRELRPSPRAARISAIALVGGLLELAFDPVDRRAVDELPDVETVVAVAALPGQAPPP